MEEKKDIKPNGHDFLFFLYELTNQNGLGYYEVCQAAREKFIEMFGIKKPEVLSFISHFAETMKRYGELDAEYLKIAKQIENKDKIFICKKVDWLYTN